MKNSVEYETAKVELEKLWKELQGYPYLYIYSAGNRAKEILQMCKLGFLSLKRPQAFLVTEMAGNRESIENPKYIDKIPVYTLNNMSLEYPVSETAVFVVAMEHYHSEIKNSLAKTEFCNIFYLTDIMERILIADFMKFYFCELDMPFQMTAMCQQDIGIWKKENNEEDLLTYMVQCEKDEKLEEKREEREWIIPLQAGAALAKKRVTKITDMDGENISKKNPYYNEMTGLYWLWKNTNHMFSGICHYRRQFESDVALQPLLKDMADVILPTPCLVYPNLRGYYLNWGEDSYYSMMHEVIKELEPAYYDTAIWCAKHEIFYPNNIFIARREIIEDYCRFAFSVIDEVEQRMQQDSGIKQKRCWLSEHVTTIYFMKHNRDYKIVFSNLKRFW